MQNFTTYIHHPSFDAQIAHSLHFIFEWLAVFVGAWLYRKGKKGCNAKAPLGVIIGCVAGAAIGNKALFLLEAPQVIDKFGWLAPFAGQTIVGGLLGGLIGVEIAKKIAGVKNSTGDRFVMPLVVAMLIGRTGCFLAGLHDGTYGIATTLPWGIDFGDGVLRHPTQIYDQLFFIIMALILWWFKPSLSRVSGLRFKILLACYLAWRLFIDAYKPIPYDYWGLSGIQLGCVIALVCYLPLLWRDFKQLKRT